MSTIYTIRRVLCTRNSWCLVRVEHQGETLVVGGTWPCDLVPGQRFRGTCTSTSRGRALDHISHVNADENAFRKILHKGNVQLKQADALFKNGMKKLKNALGSGDVRAFKRWKGVGKSTATTAMQLYAEFKEKTAFRGKWFERYPTLEEKHKPEFDQIMQTQEPTDWIEPYETLLQMRNFWGFADEQMSTSVKFATIVAHDSGIDAQNEWYQRFQRATSCVKQLTSSGSTWIRAVETSLSPMDRDPYVVEDGMCTIKKYERAEKNIARVVSRLLNVSEYEVTLVEGLDDTQSKAVSMALTQPVSILCGGAGVGKSRTIAAITKKLCGPDVFVCTPTGKAAARLMEMGIEARTLHSALFAQNVDTCRHLILDEQSMQDVVVLSSLLRRMPYLESILFVGDPFQLPSVGPGALLRDLLACGKIPTTRLTKIYRQEGGSIVQNANLIRRGNIHLTYDDSFKVLPYSMSHVIEHFIRLWDPENPPVILAALNQTVATLNKAIHKRFQVQQQGLKVSFYGYAEPWFIYPGDRMMCLQNIREEDMYVANGSIGVVLAIGDDWVKMRFSTGDIRITSPGKQLRPCYAITVHKSQGSEYDNVLCIVEPSRLMHRRMLYTAVTRSKKTCTIYETPHALTRTVRRSPEERCTRLKEYINTCCSPTMNGVPQSSPPPTVSNNTQNAPQSESENTRKRSLPQLAPSTAKRRLI